MGKIPPKILKLKEQLSTEKDISKQADIITQMEKELLEYLKKTDSDLYYFAVSGAAKGMNQLRQVLVAKGLVTDPEGNPLPPILESFNDGYTKDSYFEAAHGARKGTIDRSINTEQGGYLYRKQVYALGNVEADVNNSDCGTTRTLEIKLSEDYFKRMSGRYVVKDNRILPINEKMIGEIVNLRSPIFCRTTVLCKTLPAITPTGSINMVAKNREMIKV